MPIKIMKGASENRRNQPSRASFTDYATLTFETSREHQLRSPVNYLSHSFAETSYTTRIHDKQIPNKHSYTYQSHILGRSEAMSGRCKEAYTGGTKKYGKLQFESDVKRPNPQKTSNYVLKDKNSYASSKALEPHQEHAIEGTSKYDRILANIERKNKIIAELQQIANTPTISKERHQIVKADMKIDLKTIISKRDETKSQTDRLKQDIGFNKASFSKIKNGYYTPRQGNKQTKIREKSKTMHPPTSSWTHRVIQSQKMIESAENPPFYDSTLMVNSGLSMSQIQTKSVRDRQYSALDMRAASGARRITHMTSYFSQQQTTIQDFQIGHKLGEGKFGVVHTALHKPTGCLYALKKIRKELVRPIMDQFIKQIKIQMYCKHSRIVSLYGCFDDDSHVYLILEYMQSGHLFGRLKRQGKLSPEQTAGYVRDITQAVSYLHSLDIAHRDIKPQNIVLSNGIAKLCDFGWATVCDSRRNTYCGTFDYLPPQMLQGEKYDTSIDLWSIGVLAYELLVGEAPFYHPSRKQTMKKILFSNTESIYFPAQFPKDAYQLIKGLLQRDPGKRLKCRQVLDHPFVQRAESINF